MTTPHRGLITCATQWPAPATDAVRVACFFDDGTAYPADAPTVDCIGFLADGETALFYETLDNRWLAVGCGSRADFRPDVWRQAVGTALRRARAARVAEVAFKVPDDFGQTLAETVQLTAEAAVMGAYTNAFYRTPDFEEPPPVHRITILVPEVSDAVNAAAARGQIIGESVNWARTLADEPGGSLPPQEFARRAAEMAAEFGLTVETLDAKAVKRRGMGGLHGIGQGSDNPPALIVVRYEPPDAAPDAELWAFVGKGITFDTGGISIKPAAKMELMKSDMAGGAAALGAVRALAQLKAQQRLVAIVPAAENMPSATSIKPGDIVKTLAGYTLEVVDTDAEGRVVLVDALAYAVQLGASRIVDLATLTGSIIVALGTHRAGLFSNNDAWAAEVTRAAERAGEPVWRMPVSDDYKSRIDSTCADFKNYGGSPDAISAALLLSKFVSDRAWVHLDIAGTAWREESAPDAPAGATGAGVRTLIELATN